MVYQATAQSNNGMHPTRVTLPVINLNHSGGRVMPGVRHLRVTEPTMKYATIISQAHELARPLVTSEDCRAASVGAVIISSSGRMYTGVCLDFACGIGFCAEHAAVAEMLKGRESQIALVVAVNESGEVLPPCGRCREMMWQLNPANRDALVVLAAENALPLRELLPYR